MTSIRYRNASCSPSQLKVLICQGVNVISNSSGVLESTHGCP